MNKHLIVFGIAVLLLIVGLSGCQEDTKQDVSLVEITDLDIDSMYLSPGEYKTVTVTVENCKRCYILKNLLLNQGCNWYQMNQIDEHHYNASNIGALQNDIVWCVITAIGYSGEIEEEEFLVEVGQIERSNISSLTISNISHSKEDDSARVTADVTSNVTISNVSVATFVVDSDAVSGDCSSIQPMFNITEKTFQPPSFAMGNGPGKIYFKIVAQDESGNIAISEIIIVEFL